MTELKDAKVDIEITVNTVTFREHECEQTGLEIKQDAIAAGAKLKIGYVLDEERHDRNVRITDEEIVHLRPGLVFVAHPGGHDS
jgi:hypothetical protein